jgi:DNA ligase-associated metallophosphoesterase
MTDHSRHRLNREIVLDVRRALWIESERVLVVSDLHLGYAWAQRQRGALLPVRPNEDTIPRLAAVCLEWRPARLVLLGDIVHRALPVPEIEQAINDLIAATEGITANWLLGNHDRNLEKLVGRLGLKQSLHTELSIGHFHFAHGDADVLPEPRKGGWLVLGHEHPAISLGDGVASHMKCACFLASENTIMLPAFSPWAAGTSIHSPHWNSGIEFRQAIAICDDKLLPIDL